MSAPGHVGRTQPSSSRKLRGIPRPAPIRVARHVDATEGLLIEATHRLRVVAVDRDRPDPSGLLDHASIVAGRQQPATFPPHKDLTVDPLDLRLNFDRIAYMFEDRLESALGNARALADLATETEYEVRQLGCRKLRVAAAWADAHSDVDHPDGGMLVERAAAVRAGRLSTGRRNLHRQPRPRLPHLQPVGQGLDHRRPDGATPPPPPLGTGPHRRRLRLEGPRDRPRDGAPQCLHRPNRRQAPA